MFIKATLNITQRQMYFVPGWFCFLSSHFHWKTCILTSGTCFPRLLQYLLEEQMTDGYDLYLLVMMDCILQALPMISKYVNYNLTYYCLLKISFHLLNENILKTKKKKNFLQFSVSLDKTLVCLKDYWIEQYPCKLKIMYAIPCVLCSLV